MHCYMILYIIMFVMWSYEDAINYQIICNCANMTVYTMKHYQLINENVNLYVLYSLIIF
jgi:hypothetical protein